MQYRKVFRFIAYIKVGWRGIEIFEVYSRRIFRIED